MFFALNLFQRSSVEGPLTPLWGALPFRKVLRPNTILLLNWIADQSLNGIKFIPIDKVQSNLSTTATLVTAKKWPLYRGGRSVERFQSKLVSKLA
jgi:hypothetical protein